MDQLGALVLPLEQQSPYALGTHVLAVAISVAAEIAALGTPVEPRQRRDAHQMFVAA